jgi:hypothetical protein
MPVRESTKMTRVREACRLANDIMLDLVNGTEVYRKLAPAIPSGPDAEPARIGLTRIALFHSAITLHKWLEYHDRYLSVIPDDLKPSSKTLRQDIERRGIRKFRNNVAGHIRDDDTGRPLTNDEVEKRVDGITGGDIAGFFEWINSATSNSVPTNVVAIIEQIKDRLIKDYNLRYDELDV